MARPRKQKYDPRQLSFMFDLMTDQIGSIREKMSGLTGKRKYPLHQKSVQVYSP